MSAHKTSSRDDAACNPPTPGSTWKGVPGAELGEGRAPGADPISLDEHRARRDAELHAAMARHPAGKGRR